MNRIFLGFARLNSIWSYFWHRDRKVVSATHRIFKGLQIFLIGNRFLETQFSDYQTLRNFITGNICSLASFRKLLLTKEIFTRCNAHLLSVSLTPDGSNVYTLKTLQKTLSWNAHEEGRNNEHEDCCGTFTKPVRHSDSSRNTSNIFRNLSQC